jgi:hypothetical protein
LYASKCEQAIESAATTAIMESVARMDTADDDGDVEPGAYVTTKDIRMVGFRIATMFGAELLDVRHVLLLYRASCHAGACLSARDECGAVICTRNGALRRLAALFAIGVYDANALLLAMCRLPGTPSVDDNLALLNTLAALYATDSIGLLRLASGATCTALPLERQGHTPRSFEEIRRATIASNFRLIMQKLVDDLTTPVDYEFVFASSDDETPAGGGAGDPTGDEFAELLVGIAT